MNRLFIFITMLLLFAGCGDDEPETGSVEIVVRNKSLYNETGFYIDSGIYLDDEDPDPLIWFPTGDLSLGATVRFKAEDLVPGNYYYVYNQYELYGGAKPFQIRAGETTVVEIVI